MDEYRFPKIGDIDDLQDKAERIMSHLKSILPDDVYSKWVEHFVFERIDERQVVIAYCGNESLKEFKKEHKETVWIHICSVIGYVKKIKIYEKKADVNEDDFPVPEIGEKPKKITRGEKKTTEIPKENADYAVKGFSNETKNKIKTAKLLVLSMIFFCIMLCVAVTGLSYISNHNFRETFYSVSSLKANSKIRIVQISDLHSKTYGKDNKRLIERVKKLKPDLIIYTVYLSFAPSFQRLHHRILYTETTRLKGFTQCRLRRTRWMKNLGLKMNSANLISFWKWKISLKKSFQKVA